MADSLSMSSSEIKVGGEKTVQVVQAYFEQGDEVKATEMLTGHKQELRKSMNFVSLLALSFGNMAVWTAIAGSLSVLISGGPVVLLWGWVGVSIISCMVASCLAEFCSIWPHAAGQAFWAFQLAPSASWAPVLSYTTAMLNICGAWALISAGGYLVSADVLALATAWNPDYVQQPSHLFGCYVATLLLIGLVNIFAVRVLDASTKFSATVCIVGFLAITLALAIAPPAHQSAKFVFTQFVNETGWSSSGLVVILGLLPSSFTIIGYEASAHLAEEAHDAPKVAPRAIFWGVVSSAIAGFFFIIALLFAVTDIQTVLATPTLNPFLQILWDAMGLKGATFCIFLHIWALLNATCGITCATSRVIWSTARDKGIPGYQLWRKVNQTFLVPMYAIAFSILVPILLALIYLGSQVVFLAFFQLTTIGYLLSYGVPIALSLYRGRSRLPHAPWRMPDWVGTTFGSISVCYIIGISAMFCVPNYYPVTASTMNWTVCCLAVFAIFAVGGWYGVCRRIYKGPASQGHAIEEVVGASSAEPASSVEASETKV